MMLSLSSPSWGILPLFLSLFIIPASLANVEKTIFLAPPATILPSLDPALDDLGLQRLSPSHSALRTALNASFPTPDTPGTDSWYFLEHLTPGQRYEVRICWLATQPTDFSLKTYTFQSALDDPSLLSAISRYATTRLASRSFGPIPQQPYSPVDPSPSPDSALFLRIRAAADYFSLDPALMDDVPPVVADVILDPFLWNVFPRSLVPTAGYLVAVAGIAVVVARLLWGQIVRAVDVAGVRREGEKKRQ